MNFIHDEILVELPEHTNLALHAEIIRQLMIGAMALVVPDLNGDVKYSCPTDSPFNPLHASSPSGNFQATVFALNCANSKSERHPGPKLRSLWSVRARPFQCFPSCSPHRAARSEILSPSVIAINKTPVILFAPQNVIGRVRHAVAVVVTV